MRYLSQGWITAANQAVCDAAATAPKGPLVVDQHIEDRVSYRITIDRDTCSIVTIDATAELVAPDASFRQSASTATAVVQGSTDAHQQFLLGRILFDGSIDVLIECRDAFTWLEQALAVVMAQTTFDDAT